MSAPPDAVFSYVDDHERLSSVYRINQGAGEATVVDEECANLFDFAATLRRLSEGAFDITSGVLRKAWTFDGGDYVPSQTQIDELLETVGWHRIEWQRPVLKLRAGMQIDLGGIGKEYAVDAAATLAESVAPGLSCLINLGGDVAVRNFRQDGKPWRVGIESSTRLSAPERVVQLSRGALATSGDSRRFVFRGGHRYRTSSMRAPAGRCAMRRAPSQSQPIPALRRARLPRWPCFKVKTPSAC